MSHADTRDIQERLADEVRSWPRVEPPGAAVSVRADMITAAYSEIRRLRERENDLLVTNNRYQEEARQARRERDALLRGFKAAAEMLRVAIEVGVVK